MHRLPVTYIQPTDISDVGGLLTPTMSGVA
jgi:hypothetical protein